VPIFARQARRSSQVSLWAQDHKAITDAVAEGSAARAERLTRAHIAAYPPED
jgi:DNA-binding GntR family transcriptional regulator